MYVLRCVSRARAARVFSENIILTLLFRSYSTHFTCIDIEKHRLWLGNFIFRMCEVIVFFHWNEMHVYLDITMIVLIKIVKQYRVDQRKYKKTN